MKCVRCHASDATNEIRIKSVYGQSSYSICDTCKADLVEWLIDGNSGSDDLPLPEHRKETVQLKITKISKFKSNIEIDDE